MFRIFSLSWEAVATMPSELIHGASLGLRISIDVIKEGDDTLFEY